MNSGIEHVKSPSFQQSSELVTKKWDKEWMRYFSLNKDYSFYFYDMDTDFYALKVSPNTLKKLTAEEFFNRYLYKEVKAGVWLPGEDIVDKNVLEIGCGPGIFGRMASRFAHTYTGIDVSKFALSIAELCSPKHNTRYIHLFDADKLQELVGHFDTCFGRNFFIHHNFDDSLWLLHLLKDLTKIGGVVLGDFHYNPDSIDGHRRRHASDALSETHASALYSFDDDDIKRIAQQVGLTVSSVDTVTDHEVKYVRFIRS